MNTELEINLLDMCKKLIRYWKLILICTVAVGILFPTARYMSNRNKYNEAVANEDASKAEIDLPKLTSQEQSAVEDAWILSSMLEQDQTYMRESALMQLDPLAVPVSSRTYCLNSEDDLEILCAWLTNYVNNGGYFDEIQDQLPILIERQYLQELVSSNGSTIKEVTNLTEENYTTADDALISIYVMGDSEETAEQMATLVGEALELFDTVNADAITPHTLTLLNVDTGIRLRTDLQEKQNLVKNRIIANDAALQGKTNAFTEDQKAVYESVMELKTEENEVTDLTEKDETEQEIVLPTFSKKDVVIGVLIGLVIGVVLAALAYIFSGRLHTAEDIRNSIGIPVLTEMGSKKKWENRRELLNTNLGLVCKNGKVSSLVLATTGYLSSDEEDLAKEISDLLSKEGVNVKMAEKFLENPGGISELSKTGHLILLERIERSKFRDVCDVRRICAEMKVTILGVVLTA